MVMVKYDDLSAAFDFVSFAAPFEHHAFVSLDTGAIYWISETSPIDDPDFDPGSNGGPPTPELHGVGLPPDVLEKVYHGNAARILGITLDAR